MARITVHPEYMEGLAELVEQEFRDACEAEDVNRARAVIAFGDLLDCWGGGTCSLGVEPREVELSGLLLQTLAQRAWECGNYRMSEVYASRGVGESKPEDYEREARSMLAFHEYMQAYVEAAS